MKKSYDLYLFIVGSLLAIIPAYTYIGWIYLCVKYPDISHGETVLLFYKEILFNLLNTRFSASLFKIIFGLASEALLIISFIFSLERGDKLFKIIKLIVLILNSIFTFFAIFSIL
ncbi:MAG: hypothetical protein H6587_03165 [Flavobacteriales bacterium]|nr:hypothetical protein [Flavobacteriales bacterium]MCB9363548.1 hypothetical protein [Flavobacteriales bacterium]